MQSELKAHSQLKNRIITDSVTHYHRTIPQIDSISHQRTSNPIPEIEEPVTHQRKSNPRNHRFGDIEINELASI